MLWLRYSALAALLIPATSYLPHRRNAEAQDRPLTTSLSGMPPRFCLLSCALIPSLRQYLSDHLLCLSVCMTPIQSPLFGHSIYAVLPNPSGFPCVIGFAAHLSESLCLYLSNTSPVLDHSINTFCRFLLADPAQCALQLTGASCSV